MGDKRRVLLLIGIMASIAMLVAGVSLSALYRAAVEEERQRLTEIVRSRARFLEAVARFDELQSGDFPGGAREATLTQVREAHSAFAGFGRTGEFTLAARDGDHIHFVLGHRHHDRGHPRPVPFASDLAEPMRRALSGRSGTVVGLDYRGERVLAAHEPVAGLDMGVVAKIDLAEIRAPFVEAGLLAGGIGLAAVLCGAIGFVIVTRPMLRRLQASETRFRELFDRMPSGVAVYEAVEGGEDFVFRDFNRAAERIDRVEREGVIGRRVTEAFPGVKDLGLFQVFQRVWRTGAPECLAPGIYRAAESDPGTWRENRVHKLPTGEVVAVYDDVTQRKRVEEELRRSQAFLERVTQLSPFAMWIADGSGTVQRTNRALCQALGLAEEEIVGRYNVLEDRNLEEQGVMPQVRAVFERLEPARFSVEWSGAQTGRAEYEHVRALSIDVSMFPIVDPDGRLANVVCQWVDVTERKRAEDGLREYQQTLEARVEERTAELEAANQALEAFAYSVSHDLRAPLRAIDNFSRMLQEDHAARLDAEGLRLLGVVLRSAERMDRLITDLLTLSRLGRAEMARSRVDMARLAAETLEELLGRREDRRRISVTVAPLPPARGDSRLLRQVWANLLANALKFSRNRSEPRVQVGGRREGCETVYHVRDNGTGFDMKYAHKLFGVFQRLHSEREFEGTGVGLAIVHRIVGRHGGRVWAEAEPGLGATFFFALPDPGEE